MVSIIIPVYNEVENIRLVSEQIADILSDPFEIIFVDDGSTDGTYNAIYEQSVRDHRVKCLSLSRNFGHQNALVAGMENASGEKIVIMDGDLQHPPSLIPQMLSDLDSGFDLIQTRRNSTKDSGSFKTLSSGLFYRLLNAMSDTRIEPNAADFKAFNRKVLTAVLQFKERDLFLRGIFSLVGFKTKTIDFDAPARLHGRTKYSNTKMTGLASKGITSFTFQPLRVAFIAGLIISAVSFAFGVFALVSYFKGNTVPGWASTIIAIMILGGTQLLAIGLLGEYIASLFIETKNRPLYLVDKKINLD